VDAGDVRETRPLRWAVGEPRPGAGAGAPGRPPLSGAARNGYFFRWQALPARRRVRVEPSPPQDRRTPGRGAYPPREGRSGKLPSPWGRPAARGPGRPSRAGSNSGRLTGRVGRNRSGAGRSLSVDRRRWPVTQSRCRRRRILHKRTKSQNRYTCPLVGALKNEKLLGCSNLATPGASFVPPTPFGMLRTGARYVVLGDTPSTCSGQAPDPRQRGLRPPPEAGRPLHSPWCCASLAGSAIHRTVRPDKLTDHLHQPVHSVDSQRDG
jgi:hypothetical protein